MKYLVMLGLDFDATDAEIKQQYRKWARLLHPDREGGDKEAFQRLQEAYDYLLKKDVNMAASSISHRSVPPPP
jgi:molecular chaperone DnaJ